MLLSACMLTLNEADHVAITVPAILPFVDQLVVIDGGSADETVNILRSFGEKVRVIVEPQDGVPYSASWRQEERREKLQNICDGDWILQIDADEVVCNKFSEIRDIIVSCDSETLCFGVWRIDYAPDLYHGFLPFTAHHIIPRIWRRGAVDWLTGKAVHMLPYLRGTQTVISACGAPTFMPTDLTLHHLHRASWIGKAAQKRRSDEPRGQALSRASRMGNYDFSIKYLPDILVPTAIKKIRASQKAVLAGKLGAPDDFANFAPKLECDGRGFFLPSNQEKLGDLIHALPNPLLFVEIGSWLGSSTRFLASRTGGCVIAIDHWLGSKEHKNTGAYDEIMPNLYEKFLTNCFEYRDKILPIRRSSKEALELQIENVDLIYVDGSHDYEDVIADLRGWGERLGRSGILCGDDWLWGEKRPVQQAVKDYAATRGLVAHSAGNFWWLGQ